MRTSGATTGRARMTDLRDNVFNDFASWINENFKRNVKRGPLFKVYTGRDLFAVFINNLPVCDRQHFNCRTCMHFLERYGDLVVITEDYQVKSALFSGPEAPPDYFYTTAAEMKRAVEKYYMITEPFFTDEKVLGHREKGGWTHFYADVPTEVRNLSKVDSAFKRKAKTIQAKNAVMRTLNIYYREIPEVMNIVKAGDLNSIEKVAGPAKFLYRLHTQRNNKHFNYILWREVALAPEGYCHPKSSVLGSLMDDLAEGVSYQRAKKKFEEKVKPDKYQRPKAKPSKGNVERAEKIVRDMGIEKSLRRRYAMCEEIQKMWQTGLAAKYASRNGIFGDVPTKEEDHEKIRHTPSGGKITFRKFYETVLPEVRMMRLFIPHNYKSYTAITTAVDQSAPPILKWDHENKRNPFAWYVYSDGSVPSEWNLKSNTWVNVKTLTSLPCHWHNYHPSFPQGAIFILEDARDKNPEKHLALFPEILKNELHEIRSTIEKYNQLRELECPEYASACGLRVTEKKTNAKVYVEDFDGFGRIYHIDRWD